MTNERINLKSKNRAKGQSYGNENEMNREHNNV